MRLKNRNGVLDALPQPTGYAGYESMPPSVPLRIIRSDSVGSSTRVIRFSKMFAAPSGPPIDDAPLSEVSMTIVLSSTPRLRRQSSSRPMFWSMLSTIAAYSAM